MQFTAFASLLSYLPTVASIIRAVLLIAMAASSDRAQQTADRGGGYASSAQICTNSTATFAACIISSRQAHSSGEWGLC